jgi:hypothetical protein
VTRGRPVETMLGNAGISLGPDDAYELDWLRSRIGS